jgi:hypothetical protein
MRSEISILIVGSMVLALSACPDRRQPNMETDTLARAEREQVQPADPYATQPGATQPGTMPDDPTNTGVNVRDRDPDAVTPMDQSNAEQDLELTRTIRDQITSNDSLSIDARNVKVMSENGVVTLRGPVDSADEKAAIVEIATRTAGVTRVDDQLEVARD